MSAAKKFNAEKLMPLWIGLGVLAVIAIVVCIWLYGGGKYSGARLTEINNDDVIWTGSPENNSPTNFFSYMKIDLSGDKEKLMEPDFGATTPYEEKDNSQILWDENTSSYYQLDQGTSQKDGGGDPGGGGGDPGGGGGGPGGGGQGGGMSMSKKEADSGTATDSDGEELTARIVEYDQDKNKICEVLVVNGKLHGPGYIWDSEGRLLHKAEFKNGKPTGTSTIKCYDTDGNEAYVRKLWWNKIPQVKKEQVYRDGKILWELHWGGRGGKISVLKRWIDARVKRATDDEGNEIKTKFKKMKCMELLKVKRYYQKLKLEEEKNIYGLPKEMRTGFAELIDVGEDGKKNYRTPVDPPNYEYIGKLSADTPWEKALLEKMKALDLADKDSPYEVDVEKEEEGGNPSGMP
ncbi:MAG: hypothetical protein QF685_05870 [Verrucomicrobiota bacterium]|nr:hypothetical protein [Verrucomicrobiota bacterium]